MIANASTGDRLMIRHEPVREPSTISDRELGVAAMLLLVIVFLTSVVVPVLA